MQCDHSKDADIEKLFERVKREQNGRLDVLVNNAYSAVNVSIECTRHTYTIIIACHRPLYKVIVLNIRRGHTYTNSYTCFFRYPYFLNKDRILNSPNHTTKKDKFGVTHVK